MSEEYELNELFVLLKEERDRKMNELGMKPLLRLEKGENSIFIDIMKKARRINTKWGERIVFDLLEPHRGKQLMVSLTLAFEILQHIRLKDNAHITIIKTGVGELTRYELKE